MRVFDNVFDPEWIHGVHQKFTFNTSWLPNNNANRLSWPNGEIASHLLMGHVFFRRINDSDDLIVCDDSIHDSHELIDAWYWLLKVSGRNLRLQQIHANLQFKGMDSKPHIDSNDYNYVVMIGRPDEDVVGGEFVNETTGEVIEYKSGRVIEVDNKDKHYGRAFDTEYVPRYSLRLSGDEYRTNSN